jgi:hypothetical protein
MSDFVGYDATQNDRDLELGAVTPCEMHRIVVVDAGENRDYCKTKESALELILDGLGEYAQHDVGSLERLLAGAEREAGRILGAAVSLMSGGSTSIRTRESQLGSRFRCRNLKAPD